MLGSRVCWQLLLGWALLLGQPVFGDSDTAEEPSFQEPEELVPVSKEVEELVPVSQEPEESVPMYEAVEEPVPESQELEESVPMSEKVEEPVPVSQEPEESVTELEEPELPVLEEPEKRELTSDEKLEERESARIKWLQEDLSQPWNHQIHFLQATALEHHNKHREEFYRPFENANLKTEKAIGTMIYLQMTLVRTNCTNDQPAKEGESDHNYYYRLYHADRYPRNCETLGDSEKKFQNQDCRFTFFEDARDPGNPLLIDQNCFHLDDIFRGRFFFPPDLLHR